MPNALEESRHHRASVVLVAQVSDGAASDSRHAIQQIAIRRRADAEAEDSRRAKTFFDRRQNFGFVSDVTIGEEADEPQLPWMMRKIQGRFDPFDHHRAAFGVEPIEVAQTPLDVLRAGVERNAAEL